MTEQFENQCEKHGRYFATCFRCEAEGGNAKPAAPISDEAARVKGK